MTGADLEPVGAEGTWRGLWEIEDDEADFEGLIGCGRISSRSAALTGNGRREILGEPHAALARLEWDVLSTSGLDSTT